jgi:hypothetical protein
LQGSEFPALVFFGNRLDGMHNNEIFSRCISNLILVIKEAEAKALSLDSNRSHIIPIYGKDFFLPMYEWDDLKRRSLTNVT